MSIAKGSYGTFLGLLCITAHDILSKVTKGSLPPDEANADRTSVSRLMRTLSRGTRAADGCCISWVKSQSNVYAVLD